MRIASIFVSSVALVCLAGCSSTLDQKALEDQISSKLKEGQFPVASVSCPAGRPVKKDDAFACSAKFEDQSSASIDVKQNGDGNVSWDAKGILLVSAFTKVVDAKAKESNPKAEVSCPGQVTIAKKGSTLACKVKMEGAEQELAVTFTDDAGTWDAKTPEPKPAEHAAAAAPPEPQAAAD